MVHAFKVLVCPANIYPHTGREGNGPLVPQSQLQVGADIGSLGAHLLFCDIPTQENGELIAAQASHNVPGAKNVRENLRCLGNSLVPRLMPQCIVHALEIVQVHNEQGTGVLRSHIPQLFPDAVLQGSPVQQAGKRVFHSPLLQFLQPVLRIGSQRHTQILFVHRNIPFHLS